MAFRPEPPSTASTAEVVSDYAGYDYRSQWAGRDQVTEVETELIRRLLRGADLRRVVEIGTGFGRLTRLLASVAEEYIGVDFDPGHLAAAGEVARSVRPGRTPPVMLLANVYHLPFAPDSISTAALVRVHHHLPDPVKVLARLRDSLCPGGYLLVSYNPRPTLGTFTNDVWRAVAEPRNGRFVSLTFSRNGRVALPARPYPTYVAPRQRFVEECVKAGFRDDLELGSGLEEYTKRLPTEFYVRLGALTGAPGLFPTRFARLIRASGGTADLAPIARMLACPACRAPLPAIASGPPAPVRCERCDWGSTVTHGFHDLRYVSYDASQHTATGEVRPGRAREATAAAPGR